MEMDDKLLRSLRTKIGAEWFLLGSHLGFSTSQLEHLQNANPYNIPRCISTMLTKWHDTVIKTQEDGTALLLEALSNVGRTDLADEISGNGRKEALDEVDSPSSGVESNIIAEKPLFKLIKQVSFSSGSRPIDKYIDQSLQYLEHKQKNNENYVSTRAFRSAEDVYRTNQMLTVVGNPGDGKSMLAEQIILKLKEEGNTVIVLADPALIEDVYDSKTHCIFFIDDAFGTPTLNRSLIDIWGRLYEKLESWIESKKCGLIVTSRKQVFTQTESILNKCKGIMSNAVDISAGCHQFTVEERLLIASQYIKGIDISKHSLKIPVKYYIPGFPLMCKLFSMNHFKDRDPSDFFENPVIFLKQQLEHMCFSDPVSYCGLVLLTMFDGKLSRDIFNEFEEQDQVTNNRIEAVMKCCGLNASTDKTKVETNLDSMVGVYVEIEDNEFKFLHDSIFDGICFVFGRKRPKEILKVASASFVERRIRTQGVVTDDNVNDVIVLSKGRYPDLAKRWLKDMKSGNLSTIYDNPSFEDNYMNAIFMDSLRSLSEEDIWYFVNMCDKKRGKTYIYLACKAGLESAVVSIMSRIFQLKNLDKSGAKPDILSKSLLEVIKAGYLEAAGALLKMDMLDIGYVYDPSKRQIIHYAVLRGHDDILESLIKHGADINKRDSEGAMPIHYACQLKTTKCLEILLRHNAKIHVFDCSGRLPIHYAAKQGSLETVERLIGLNDDPRFQDLSGEEAIHFAACNDDHRVLEYLIKYGISVNRQDFHQMTPLHYACKSLILMNIQTLITAGAKLEARDRDGNLPIHCLCELNTPLKHIAFLAATLLIESKSCVNELNDEKQSPLHLASSWTNNRSYKIVQLLLQNGADPNVQDMYQNYPIINACAQGSLRTLQLLVDNGASANVFDGAGEGILHYIGKKPNIFQIDLFKNLEIDIKRPNRRGKQPIHIACQYGNDVALRYLIENGADVNCQDSQGMTPLHFSCRWNKMSTVNILVKSGVDPCIRDKTNNLPMDLLPTWNLHSMSCVKIKEILTDYVKNYINHH